MSNPINNKFLKRFSRPRTFASSLGNLMQIMGVAASDSDLLNRWDKIMGSDIANIAELNGIKSNKEKKFIITIRAKSPAFSLQLSYQKTEIIDKINKYFGYDAVSKIIIKK